MSTTQKVILATAAALLAYEGWTLFNQRKNDTLSEGIWEWNEKMPFIPFSAGVLCGHWFWPKTTTVNIEVSKDDGVK